MASRSDTRISILQARRKGGRSEGLAAGLFSENFEVMATAAAAVWRGFPLHRPQSLPKPKWRFRTMSVLELVRLIMFQRPLFCRCCQDCVTDDLPAASVSRPPNIRMQR